MEVSDEIQAPAALFPAPTEYEASVDFFFFADEINLLPLPGFEHRNVQPVT
jgi:hypothetical protein